MSSYRFTIFLAFVLAAATLQAQRMSGGASGASPAGNGNTNRMVVPGNGLIGRHGSGHHHRSGDGAIWLPYGYFDDWDDSDSDYAEDAQPDNGAPESAYSQPANGASRPMPVMASQRPVTPPPQSPKIIEIPLSKNDAAAKPQGPAVFVMTSGERLESQNYVLTSDWLRAEIGHKQVTIPLSSLDVKATIAANQERGIAMNFPRDRSSVYLSF